jgi:predicted dehydrogenase
MQNKYRVCVIGCGVISPNHIKPLLANEKTELVAVCDVMEERAKSRAELGRCAYYTDYHQMLEEVKPDAVHLCLPHYLHAPVAIDCMRAGADVLCEKPMDASLEAALRMKEVSEETGRRLGVIFQNRYNEENVTIYNALKSGEMGKLLMLRGTVCWKRDQAYYNSGEWRSDYATAGGGVIINQAIHTLDLLRYFAGSPVADVRATVSHHGETLAEVEDTAEGLILFENGVRALFYFTINNFEDEDIRVTIKCENARVESRAGDCCIHFLDGHDVHISNDEHAAEAGAKACYGSSHALQIADFYNDPDGSRARWMMDEALKTQKLVDAILRVSGVMKD